MHDDKTARRGIGRSVAARDSTRARATPHSSHPTTIDTMLASASTFTGVKVVAKATAKTTVAKRAACVTRAGQYDDELLETAVRATTRRDATRDDAMTR